MRIHTVSLSLAACAALTLTGCGESDSPESVAEAPEAQAPATPQAQPPAPPEKSAKGAIPVDPGKPGNLPGDVPVPDGAAAQHPPMEAMGAVRAAYTVADSTSNVRDWYHQALTDAGWEIARQRDIGSDFLMSAEKDGRQLTVAITEGDGETQLMVLHHRGDGGT